MKTNYVPWAEQPWKELGEEAVDTPEDELSDKIEDKPPPEVSTSSTIQLVTLRQVVSDIALINECFSPIFDT